MHNRAIRIFLVNTWKNLSLLKTFRTDRKDSKGKVKNCSKNIDFNKSKYLQLQLPKFT